MEKLATMWNNTLRYKNNNMETIQVQQNGDVYSCDIGISKEEWLWMLMVEFPEAIGYIRSIMLPTKQRVWIWSGNV